MPAPITHPPTPAQLLRHLRHANDVARQAAAQGHHPFGAILVAADHETVLLTQGNIDTVNHAEATLAREAAARFSPDELWGCTLYTTVEPCCMCTGTAYWAHIGRIVYGMSEADLLRETGHHAENPTMDLPCRKVLAAGQQPIEVIGPVAEVAPEIVALHRGFWTAPAAPGTGA